MNKKEPFADEFSLSEVNVPNISPEKRRYGRRMNVKKSKNWKQIPYRFGK